LLGEKGSHLPVIGYFEIKKVEGDMFDLFPAVDAKCYFDVVRCHSLNKN